MDTYVIYTLISVVVIIGMFALGTSVGKAMARNERIFEGKLYDAVNSPTVYDNHSNVSDSTVGSIHEPIDCGQDLERHPEAEEATIRLNYLRTGGSPSEQRAIDYAIDCIAVRIALEDFFERKEI